MTNRQTSVNLTPATERQVEWLKAQGHGQFTDLVRIAIDRMATQEGMNIVTEYYVQVVQGTNAQTGHLSDRIRILTKPARGHTNLSDGWLVSDTDGPITENGVRELLLSYGIKYPAHIPIVRGDYSTSDPDWNSWYYEWNTKPDQYLPRDLQPLWYQRSNT